MPPLCPCAAPASCGPVAASVYPRLFWLFTTGARIVGGGAVAGLGYGCVQVVRETGLAVQNLTEEARR